MQSSDPSVTIGTKFSHLQESSSECDSLQTWASVQPASSSQHICRSTQQPWCPLHSSSMPGSPRGWQEQGGKGGTQGEEKG